jgi:hypothetical protein
VEESVVPDSESEFSREGSEVREVDGAFEFVFGVRPSNAAIISEVAILKINYSVVLSWFEV